MPLDLLRLQPRKTAAPARVTVPADFLEYAQKYGWVQDKETQLYGPFTPNKHQLAVRAEIARQHAMGKPALIVVLKARQLGITTYVLQEFLHRALLQEGRNSLLVVQDQETQGTLHDDKLRLQFDHLPEELRGKEKESNRKRLVLANGSRFIVQISTGVDLRSSNVRQGRSASQRKGRGGTYQYNHNSEYAFWVDAENTSNAINQMVHPVPGNIRIYESTANGKGGAFHDMWYAAVAGENEYFPQFFTWINDDTCRMSPPEDFERSDEEWELAAQHSLDDHQLYWRRWVIRNNCAGNARKFHQECPITPDEAFLTSGECWFDADKLALLDRRVKPPLAQGHLEERSISMLGSIVKRTEVVFVERKGGNLRIYKHPEKRRAYAIGADVGHGTATGAFSAAQVGTRDTLEQVAVSHARIKPGPFAEHLRVLGRYYNTAWMAPEVNDAGIYVVGKLVESDYPDTRLYHHRDPADNSPTADKRPGWITTSRTRQTLCHEGMQHVHDLDVEVPDAATVAEMRTFVNPGNDSPVPAPGCYSDLLIAWFIMLVVAPGRMLRY